MLIAALAFATLPFAARAAGALAIGMTSHPEAGFAFGTAWNFATEKEAREAAVQRCHASEDAPEAAKFCLVIGSFDRGCLAIAFDPKDDSPGVGWAIAQQRAVAEQRALDSCRARSPVERRPFCKLATSHCEGDE